MDGFASVQKFFALWLLQDETKQSLVGFEALIDDQIQIANDAKENNPFALPQRIIQVFINRWSRMSKALQVVAKPPKVCGDNVFNLTPEADDKKRKDRDLYYSTTPGADDEKKGRNRQTSANDELTWIWMTTTTTRISKTLKVASATRSSLLRQKPRASFQFLLCSAYGLL